MAEMIDVSGYRRPNAHNYHLRGSTSLGTHISCQSFNFNVKLTCMNKLTDST